MILRLFVASVTVFIIYIIEIFFLFEEIGVDGDRGIGGNTLTELSRTQLVNIKELISKTL